MLKDNIEMVIKEIALMIVWPANNLIKHNYITIIRHDIVRKDEYLWGRVA